MVAVAWSLALMCSIPQFFLFKLEDHHYCHSNHSFQVINFLKIFPSSKSRVRLLSPFFIFYVHQEYLLITGLYPTALEICRGFKIFNWLLVTLCEN
jgi:hypothetical protein